jgi:hypothetical protein
LAVRNLGKCGIPRNTRSQGRHRPDRPEFIHSESEVSPCQHPKTTNIHVLLRVAGAILKDLNKLNCRQLSNNLGRNSGPAKRSNEANIPVLSRRSRKNETRWPAPAMAQAGPRDGGGSQATPLGQKEHVSNGTKPPPAQNWPPSTRAKEGRQIHINTDQHGEQPKIQGRLG